MQKRFIPYVEAKKILEPLRLRSKSDYDAWHKNADEGTRNKLPKHPQSAYGEDWISLRDFLRNESLYLPYDKAIQHIRFLKLNSLERWKAFVASRQLPKNIPAHPEFVYEGNGWTNMDAWLGIEKIRPHKKKFLSFEKATSFVQKIGITNQAQWRLWCRGRFDGNKRKPPFIPVFPHEVYKNDGWQSWEHFFGIQNSYLSFEEARDFVRALGFKIQKEWNDYAKSDKRPSNIPQYPKVFYRNKGFISMGDWIGVGEKFLPFEEARAFARTLKLSGQTQWRLYVKNKLPHYAERPEHIPSAPEKVYKEWISFADWLGTKHLKKTSTAFPWKSYEEATAYAKEHRIISRNEWYTHVKWLPEESALPIIPYFVYKDKWISWADFLGTARQRRDGALFDYDATREYILQQNIETFKEWLCFAKEAKKNNLLPENVAMRPNHAFKERWLGWKAFLGK